MPCQVGISRFDAAAGGLGGCPYAPGASGNVNIEELVHMFDCMHVHTGVALGPLLPVMWPRSPLSPTVR